MESIDKLGEFFRHCLNVGGCTRPNGHTSPLWCGWMRCKITPYLINGKVHPYFVGVKGDKARKFKNILLYTLQDYIDYISCFSYKNDNTIKTTNDLLNILDKMDENDIISMIEDNKDKFPSQSDCNNDNVLDEKYNTKLNLEVQEQKIDIEINKHK